MKRTVNLTGKKRITQDLVSAEIIEDDSSNSAKVIWNLTALGIKQDAELIFETYSFGQTSRDLVPLNGNESGEKILNLVNFKKDSSINLYLRVVDSSAPVRRILAESAAIALLPGKTKEGDNSLLKVQAKNDLLSLWQVDYSLGEPVLQISNRNGIYADLISQQIFMAAVLPAALSGISFTVISQPEVFNSEVLMQWESALTKFGLTENRLGELREILEIEAGQGNSLPLIQEEANAISQRFAARFDMAGSIRESNEDL